MVITPSDCDSYVIVRTDAAEADGLRVTTLSRLVQAAYRDVPAPLPHQRDTRGHQHAKPAPASFSGARAVPPPLG
jgi:hypothetical protein